MTIPLIPAFRDIVVIGGGCYGSFYAAQLDQARRKGKVEYARVVVVDRDPACRARTEPGEVPGLDFVTSDWDAFLDRYLAGRQGESGGAGPEDAIVPSPLMPHLMYHWLVRRARARWPGRAVETRALDDGPGTPYDTVAPDQTRYVSFADWICPTHCIEPATCPVIRAPRTWEMGEVVGRMTERLGRARPTAGPVLFTCRHTVFGVGTFGVRSVLDGDRVVEQAGAGGGETDIVVGTVSACHGALNLLHLGPA